MAARVNQYEDRVVFRSDAEDAHDFAPWSVKMRPNRGGSFRRHDPESFTTFAIEHDSPEVKQDDLGFRCCFSFPRDGGDSSGGDSGGKSRE